MNWQVVIIGVLFSLLSACRHLPEYARPYIGSEPYDLSGTQVITYRELSRTDFRALNLPDNLKEHGEKLNAHTALSIRPAADSKYLISSTHYNNQPLYSGRLENFRFEAVMIPVNSWWKPDLALGRRQYVLQHEQIHFALMELTARRLTERAVREKGIFTVINTTHQEVRKELVDKVNVLIKSTRKEIFEEHSAFDRDTSQVFNPLLQNWWFEKVTSQLQIPVEGD
jgi:hypothetical protein